MPLVSNDDVVRIDLTTEGEWVEVKRRLSKHDQTAVQLAVIGDERVSVSSNGPSSLDSIAAGAAIEAAQWATLDVALVRWAFTEDAPPARADVRRLSEEDYDLIVARLNELYAPRSKEEQGNSGGSGATSS